MINEDYFKEPDKPTMYQKFCRKVIEIREWFYSVLKKLGEKL